MTIDARPLVAIVGRPNVGKSTLFNRLVGQQIAVVEDLAGTTRDRLYSDCEWAGRSFVLIDTGGLVPRATSDITHMVHEQVRMAMDEADVLIFLVDAKDGATAMDHEIAELVRRSGKPLVLAANKAESPKRRDEIYQFYELGVGEPLAIGAKQGIGTGDLLDMVVSYLPPTAELPEPPVSTKLAIVGRPNVGKSSLLNAVLGQERVIVSEVPGTTRDAVDTYVELEGERFLAIDTAGIRRKGRIEQGVERYSVLRAMRAIDRCDVAVLVLDATELVAAQDLHVAGYVTEAYKGVLIVVNKWDLVEKESQTQSEFTKIIQHEFKFMPWAPILFVSAKLGRHTDEILPAVKRIAKERMDRVPTGLLNRAMEEAVTAHNPPAVRGKRLKILYVTQADVNPPTFVFFVNDAQLMHFSYQRYIENRLRDAFGFFGTPIKLVFRNRGESET
ncbi:MAG: ribosome biogenesis GTPase Der [Chloroflexota bacterium]|nr:MAG: ribosome biogenesis GTPase Der [Chloroflexota bacterium]